MQNSEESTMSEANTSAAKTKEDLRFVTITDISQRDNAKNRKIVRSHAMRYAHKSIKPPPSNPLVPDARNSFGVFSSNRDLFPPPAAEIANHEPSDGAVVLRAKLGMGRYVRVRNSGTDPAREQEIINRWKRFAPDPITLVGAGRVDPFASCPVKPKPYMDFLVDHYVNVLSPSQIPVAGLLNPLVTQMLPLARCNAILFHAILCLSASHVSTVRGIQEPGYWEKFHRTETFKLLNAALADPDESISDVTVATILIVSGHDVLFGSHDVHEEHMKGLDRVVVRRGGADKLGLDGLLERLFCWATHFRALRTSASAQISEEESDGSYIPSQSADADENVQDASVIIPERLMSLYHSNSIGSALLTTIKLLITLTTSLNNRVQSPSVASENAMIGFNEQRNQLERRLNRQRERLANINNGSIEECTCLALLMYSHSMLRQLPPASGTLSVLNAQLKIALNKMDLTPLWGKQYMALIWIIFMGNATTTSKADRAWYAGLLRLIFAAHSELGPSEVTKILQEFLWCPMYDSATGELWALIKSGHERSAL